MKLPLFVVDAFTDTLFRGNPAAVCPLESWLPDATMQSIAAENNQSETAFFVARAGHYELRWFTPTQEVNLCGHATLAAAFILHTQMGTEGDALVFITRSGPLKATRSERGWTLDLPATQTTPYPIFDALGEALGDEPQSVRVAGEEDYVALFETEAEIRALKPRTHWMAALDRKGVIVTAPGKPGSGVDFVSRYFAPGFGIPEDPVTGAAHAILTPYWSARLGKTELHARQLSARGGALVCELKGDRVWLTGQAILYAQGLLHLPDAAHPALAASA